MEHYLVEEVGVNDTHVAEKRDKAWRIILECDGHCDQIHGVAKHGCHKDSVLSCRVPLEPEAFSFDASLNQNVCTYENQAENAVEKYDDSGGGLLENSIQYCLQCSCPGGE